MVVLKKIKASSLNEVIVATVIIVLIFGIAVGMLTNIMQNKMIRNTHAMQNQMNELIYQYNNGQIKVPYVLVDDDLHIEMKKEEMEKHTRILVTVQNKVTNKLVTRIILPNEEN